MKKLLAGILAVTMLFALTACTNTGNGNGENGGGKASKDMTEVTSKLIGNGKITMSVPKNDDGTPKFDFTATAPEGLQQFIANKTSSYLVTDKATFAFSASKMVYNTSKSFKEKYGEQPASFEKYLE
ncbi:MAG: hypothetical protein IJR47_01210, partial [Clostridia bacterium]|nr:hypothetical protein [Clostridia bacterium]